jgi:hypothetical protein
MTDLTNVPDSEILSEYFKRFQQPKKIDKPLPYGQLQKIEAFLARSNARKEPNFILSTENEDILNHPFLISINQFGR